MWVPIHPYWPMSWLPMSLISSMLFMCYTKPGPSIREGKYWSRCASVRHQWWRTKRSWPLFSPTFFLLLVQACLRAPPVVADEAKLAIVFTYFWSRRACVRYPWWRMKRSWPLFSPNFLFFFLRKLIFRCFLCSLWPVFGRGNLYQP